MIVVLWLSAAGVLAGGSGLNVVVVVNQNSTNSIQLGNYFRERRNVPPQNFLRLNWTGGNVEWAPSDFNTTLLNPLLALLAGGRLTNQIDYVVLSMDIPYRVTDPVNGANSTTSTLFYGFIPDSRNVDDCPLADASTNNYAGSEAIFRLTPPISAASNSFLVTMITASNLALAKQIVDQGVAGDSTFPPQTVLLVKTTDTTRNVRFTAFDNAIFNTRLRGNYSMQRIATTGYGGPSGYSNLLGFQTGAYDFGVDPNTFVPGAVADNLTSFGGQIFEDSGQANILSFLAGGASGTFGTVIEPCNYLQKFPDSQDYFYQARGFSLAECYYMSVTNPYQGLVMGEPLSAPFASPGTGVWMGLPTNAILAGITNLAVDFTAADALHPLQQVDLFVDGTWLETITNIAPGVGNLLTVTVNGHSANYTVPTGRTIASVTEGLLGALSETNFQSLAGVNAYPHGDRIELQSANPFALGAQLSLTAGASGSPQTTFLTASRTNFLDAIGSGLKACEIVSNPTAASYLQVSITKTNGTTITLAVTNVPGGTLPQLTQNLLNLINGTPGLEGSDGLTGTDLQAATDASGNPLVAFNLIATGVGYAASQISITLTGSSDMTITPTGANTLTDNLTDLIPRNHLYVTAGVTNLAVNFPLNTSTLADGYHELVAVAYEGSHVRTQTRAVQEVIVHNTPLSATLTTLVGGPNTALEATLQFLVTVNTNNNNTIQLFGTGGLLATANGQSATLSVGATNLGLGLHPFYAVVSDNHHHQYRTLTTSIRIVGVDSPFTTQIGSSPLLVTWPAAAGRAYQLLTATNASGPYQLRTTITPANSLGQWREANTSFPRLFYQVNALETPPGGNNGP